MTTIDSNRVKIGFASLGVGVLCLTGWIVNLQMQMGRIQSVTERADQRAGESFNLHHRNRRSIDSQSLCPVSWRLSQDRSQNGGRAQNFHTLIECKDFCAANSGCTGLDWDNTRAPGQQCFTVTEAGELIYRPNVDHYDIEHEPCASSGGSTYVRWGRMECPNTTSTELVYEGIMGGSYYGHHGGGNDYMCLPRQPEWLHTKPGVQGAAYMYGVEYETGADGRSGLLYHKTPTNLQNHDAVCAVCHIETRSSQLMIPGKVTCQEGWTREYFGYLMTSHHGHAGAKNFICVDSAPEADNGGNQDQNGALLYFVEARCGSLPCPTYVDGNEIACVVCSK